MSALTGVGFAVVVYPILVFFERFPGFSRLTTERSRGELKHSLLLVFSMFALVTAVVSAAAELISRDGMDTVICSLSAMVILILMTRLFGGMA